MLYSLNLSLSGISNIRWHTQASLALFGKRRAILVAEDYLILLLLSYSIALYKRHGKKLIASIVNAFHYFYLKYNCSEDKKNNQQHHGKH